MRDPSAPASNPSPAASDLQALYRRLIVLLLTAVALAVITSSETLHTWLLEILAYAETIIRTQPKLGLIVFVVLAAASAMLAFVSSSIIVPVGVLVWGPNTTMLLLWLGWTLGGITAYTISRSVGRRIIRAVHLEDALSKYEKYLSPRTPFSLVLLFQTALPSEVPGYLLGLARYPFKKFALALAIAELPYAVATIYLGSSFLERRTPQLLAAALLLAAFSAFTLQTLRNRLR